MQTTSDLPKTPPDPSVGSGDLFGWIDCKSRMPDGWERKVFAWIVWPDGCGWRDQPEAVVAWWKHGPACFAYEDVEHANHLVKYWMEIPSLPEPNTRSSDTSEASCL